MLDSIVAARDDGPGLNGAIAHPKGPFMHQGGNLLGVAGALIYLNFTDWAQAALPDARRSDR
jgi:hypothetical protein